MRLLKICAHSCDRDVSLAITVVVFGLQDATSATMALREPRCHDRNRIHGSVYAHCLPLYFLAVSLVYPRLDPQPQSETAVYDYGPSHVPMSHGGP